MLSSTKSLKEMAARAVMRANPPKSFLDKLTPDLRTLLTTTDLNPDRGHLELKSRDCPTACLLRVGGFADAPPDALNKYGHRCSKSLTSLLQGVSFSLLNRPDTCRRICAVRAEPG